MVTSVQLQNELTRKLHRIDSEYGKALSVQEKDMLLNEAKDMVYENIISAPEWNSLRRSHLRQLEVKRKVLNCSDFDGASCVASFPENYFRLLRTTAWATTSTCSTKRELIVHIVQSHKISEALKSPNWEPSFEYEETVGDEGENGLYVWHNGKFNIESVVIDYMKILPNIYTPSLICDTCGPYKDEKGQVRTTDVNLIIDSTALWRKIVDVAVLLANRDLSDYNAFQTQLNTIMAKERTYV